ncbi:hypothetical protein NW760_012651 [Fusarium oxysporum]|nr:hypothetical protein NW760_012651 [Fusarium oxysporum]
MAVYNIPTMLGLCLIWKLDRESQKIGLLFGYYMVTAYVASLVLALQMPSSNLGGYIKRVTGTALVFAAYCAGNVIGPHAFLAREAPVYQTGVIIMKRDHAATESVQAPEDTSADVTDFNNPHFRYVL